MKGIEAGMANLSFRVPLVTVADESGGGGVVLKSVGVLSCARVLGILYALLGLLIGLPIAFFSLIGAVASTGSAQSGSGGLIFGTLFGVGAVIFLHIFYGIIGFVGGLVSAFLYNLIACLVGGIELEVEQRDGRVY